MSSKCPRCGSDYYSEDDRIVSYDCDTEVDEDGEIHESNECLMRQLAEAKCQLAMLNDKNKEVETKENKMSEENVCPKCGSRVCHKSTDVRTTYLCGTIEYHKMRGNYNAGELEVSQVCLQNQNRNLEAQLIEATKAGTPFWKERDYQNAITIRINELEEHLIDARKTSEENYLAFCRFSKALHMAAGYVSTYKPHKKQHPEEVKDMFLQWADEDTQKELEYSCTCNKLDSFSKQFSEIFKEKVLFTDMDCPVHGSGKCQGD